jgi:predicted ribosome quality control (RQC) complex YloA/Tae2 family protein
MCTHETSITVVRVILNTLLTEIDGSFTWEDDTILVGHRRTGLKNDVHITCKWENRMLEYIASGNIPVRVGQTAKENDHLTTTSDPKYWWMHASGYPGAHIVVCYEGEELPKDVKRDAAVLALYHSKTPDSKMSWVDLVRVENVSSLRQHGRVTLHGEVVQLTIFMRKEKERLERILKTQSKPLYVPAM